MLADNTVLKGGPGSGHFGHRGRPGLRGGSLPGGGAASNIHAWMAAKRRGLPAPVRQKIRDRIKEVKPGATDDECDMYIDVMGLDRKRFRRYAEVLGLDPSMEDEFFKEQEQLDSHMAREMLRVQDAATYKSGSGHPELMATMSDDMYARVTAVVGKDASEVVSKLYDRYGVTVDIRRKVDDDTVHQEMSWLYNLAESDPVLGKVLSTRVKKVVYDKRPSRSTAAMQWRPDGLYIYPDVHTAANILHELGHAYEDASRFDSIKSGFGRGRTVSSYAWTNYSEDFAETFVAVVGGRTGYRDWVPDKYDAILRSIEEYVK